MPTVVKTFSFANDAQGLADAANSAVTFAWQSADSQTGSGGCVKFTYGTKASTATEFARNSSTGETWETWGVPAGNVVSAVQVTAWYAKTATATKLSSHSLSARVIGSSGASVHSAGDLIAGAALSATVTAWVAQSAGTQRAVDQGSQASTTDVRLDLEYAVTTSGGGGSASTDARFDEISITITHDVPAATEHTTSVAVDGSSAAAVADATRETLTSTTMDGASGLDADATVSAGATEHTTSVAVDSGSDLAVAGSTRETGTSAAVDGGSGLTIAGGTRETGAGAIWDGGSALSVAGAMRSTSAVVVWDVAVALTVAAPTRETTTSTAMDGAGGLEVDAAIDGQGAVHTTSLDWAAASSVTVAGATRETTSSVAVGGDGAWSVGAWLLETSTAVAISGAASWGVAFEATAEQVAATGPRRLTSRRFPTVTRLATFRKIRRL